jgi:hypothetical protein
MHREVYFSEPHDIGRKYFALGKNSRNKEDGIAEVFKDIMLKKINPDSLNLHLHLYHTAKKHFWEIKKDMMEKSKANKMRELS